MLCKSLLYASDFGQEDFYMFSLNKHIYIKHVILGAGPLLALGPYFEQPWYDAKLSSGFRQKDCFKFSLYKHMQNM